MVDIIVGEPIVVNFGKVGSKVFAAKEVSKAFVDTTVVGTDVIK